LDDEREADGRRDGDEDEPPPVSGAGAGRNQRDRTERRYRGKGAQILDRVERRVDLFSADDEADSEAEPEHEAEAENADAVRRDRFARRQRRIEDPELLDLFALLEALRELRFFVALQQRLVALLDRRVIARKLLELLLAFGHVLHALLVAADRLPQCPLFVLERSQLGIDVGQRVGDLRGGI